jgi:adenine-specific DNA-methyltransferase
MRAQAHDSSSAPSRHELGQFFTPDPLADFMATMFRFPGRDIRLLDAGAGAGALTAALVRRAVGAKKKPRYLEVTAYEVDARVIPELESTLADCRAACTAANITFTASVHREDFIDAAARGLAGGLFNARWEPRFDAAIVNPPYRKMRSDSDARRLLRSVGVETSNLYTAFLALIVQLLVPGGELVSITPRSFCNGPYFKPFRQLFLREMALKRLHVFESRSALFSAESVLQENIIVHALRSTEHADTVSVSATTGLDTGISYSREVPYSSVVSESDPDRFIHVAPDESLEPVYAWRQGALRGRHPPVSGKLPPDLIRRNGRIIYYHRIGAEREQYG